MSDNYPLRFSEAMAYVTCTVVSTAMIWYLTVALFYSENLLHLPLIFSFLIAFTLIILYSGFHLLKLLFPLKVVKVSKFVIFFLCSLLVGIILIVIVFPTPSVNFVTDKYYHHLYEINKEEGNATINDIVSETRQYENSSYRLIKIAEMITNNFTDYWWTRQSEERFCRYNDNNGSVFFQWCSPLFGTALYGLFNTNPNAYTYVVDKIGNVTVRETNDLSFNPYWIAYQKAGACQAISVLFNETANRSGFVTRVVRSSGIEHMWNEVYIDGDWKYFDIQKYGGDHGYDSSYYGDRMNYTEDLYNLTRCGVYTLNWSDYGFGEEITQSYDPNFSFPHGKYNSPRC